MIELLHGMAGMGIQMVFGSVINDYQIAPIEVMGREVIPAIADA